MHGNVQQGCRDWYRPDHAGHQVDPVGGGQRLVLLRLKKGPIFLASFANGNLPVMVTDASGRKREIRGFFGALSYDDGETWPLIRLITDDGPEREMKTTNGRAFTMSTSSGEPKG
jgi:sulfatase modifying factor 1